MQKRIVAVFASVTLITMAGLLLLVQRLEVNLEKMHALEKENTKMWDSNRAFHTVDARSRVPGDDDAAVLDFAQGEPSQAADGLFEITPVPQTSSSPKKKDWHVPMGTVRWSEKDPNFQFSSSSELPSIGIVTLNAQHGRGGKIKTSHQNAATLHQMSFHNKVEYCRHHGIDLIVEDNSIVDQTRDVAWSKIPILKKWLPKYQWLLWMDMDAFFMRYDVDVRIFLDNNKDLIVSRDWNGINLGVAFFRNSPFTMYLLSELWLSPRVWWDPWQEQSAMMNLMKESEAGRERAEMILAHIKIVPQREINAYPAEFSVGFDRSRFLDGDFIAHFPNCKSISSCFATIRLYYQKSLMDNAVPPLKEDVPTHWYPESSVVIKSQ